MSDIDAGQDNTTSSGEQTESVASENAATETQAPGNEGQETAAQGQGDETASGQEAQGAGETETPEVPDEYAFTMPEGMEMDNALAEAIGPIFKDLGLSQDQATQLVDAYAKNIQSSQAASDAAFNKQMEDWKAELKNDPDIGGDDFDKNVGIAIQAIDKFGSPELRNVLDTTGLGNNPEVIKFLHKVGSLTVEDQPGSGNRAAAETSAEQRLYPNEAAQVA